MPQDRYFSKHADMCIPREFETRAEWENYRLCTRHQHWMKHWILRTDETGEYVVDP